MSEIKKRTRCAVYTRKSNEEGLEQEFNSLDAQRHACENYVAAQRSQGWMLVPDYYDDGGFTGGNTERPALKRLLKDIEEGRIDTVVVYKIDRLSRSLLDFLNMMKVFEEHNVAFVSVTRTNGYNAFITWYANLQVGGVYLKNNIDGFIIGSELVGLTQFMSTTGVFPAVTQLKSLAATVKTAVGAGVKVMYCADWSEYHSVNGWFNLDPLWSDSNIDVVAIDCYFPLTPDLPQTQIDYNAVYNGWTSGEGWDYYYTDSVARTGQTSYGGNHAYAWKDVKYWWSHTHTNPDTTTTAWTTKMKPVWFSELGFPSVDCCANQPNVFIDPDSIENFYPRGSRGRVDFLAQRTALDASIDYLNAQNVLEANFVPRKFIWTWDARPFPFFPDLASVWADGDNWKTGHWLQGKLGLSSLGQIIADLLKKVGYDSTMYDVSRLTDIVSGFIITNRQTVRSCLEQLATAYFFDCVESDGLLKFIKRGKVSGTTIDFTELVAAEENGDTLTVTRTQEFSQRLTRIEQIREAMLTHTARAGEKLRYNGLLAQRMMVFMHTSPHTPNEPFHYAKMPFKLPFATNDTMELSHYAVIALDQMFQPGHRYMKCGIELMDIVPQGAENLDLFSASRSPRSAALMQTLDKLNQKMGRNTVKFGGSGIVRDWNTKRDLRSPRYTTDRGELFVVQAN